MSEATKTELTRTFTWSIGLLALGLTLALAQTDDGLRHVGLAFGPERSWGEVYPFSQFEVFADYDPWWGYDRALHALAALLSLLAYMNRGRVCELARRTGAAFLIDGRAHELDPADMACLQRQGDDGALRIWAIDRSGPS